MSPAMTDESSGPAGRAVRRGGRGRAGTCRTRRIDADEWRVERLLARDGPERPGAPGVPRAVRPARPRPRPGARAGGRAAHGRVPPPPGLPAQYPFLLP